jgi:endoglucanase
MIASDDSTAQTNAAFHRLPESSIANSQPITLPTFAHQSRRRRVCFLLVGTLALIVALLVVAAVTYGGFPTLADIIAPRGLQKSTFHSRSSSHFPSSPSTLSSAPPTPLIPHIGVCLSGLEDGDRFPGTPGVDYAIPTAAEYQYFHSKRLNMVRLPFSWERIQPVLNGSLDPTIVSILQSQLAIAATLDITVLLDCHSYARYNGSVINGTDGAVTDQHFADLWRRMAEVFRGSKGLHGYDLMNEPHDMPSLYVWPQAAQAAIAAIRSVDKTTPIHLEGNEWSAARSWTEQNPGFPLSDPSNLIVYSAHCYLDRDNSGTHFVWDEEAAHGTTIHTGEERLADFVNWVNNHSVAGHVGEMGIGYDNENWFIALNLSMAVMAANNLQFTYWAGGPFFADYPMGVDPDRQSGLIQDRRQMAVLTKYSGDRSPPAYWLSGPSTGPASGQSGNFTVDVRGWLGAVEHGFMAFRCYDSVSTEPFVRLRTETEFNALINFTYSSQAAGQYQIYCINNRGLHDADPVVYTAQ